MLLESLLGHAVKVVDAMTGEDISRALVVCTSAPEAMGFISPYPETATKEYGLLMYNPSRTESRQDTSKDIVYFPESTITRLGEKKHQFGQKEPIFAILDDEFFTHIVKKDDTRNDSIYSRFAEYLRSVGITPP